MSGLTFVDLATLQRLIIDTGIYIDGSGDNKKHDPLVTVYYLHQERNDTWFSSVTQDLEQTLQAFDAFQDVQRVLTALDTIKEKMLVPYVQEVILTNGSLVYISLKNETAVITDEKYDDAAQDLRLVIDVGYIKRLCQKQAVAYQNYTYCFFAGVTVAWLLHWLFK